MKEQRYGTLGGLTVPVLIYESYEEADAIVPNGMLKAGNDNLVYRGVLNDVRDLIVDEIVAPAVGEKPKQYDKNGKETTVDKDTVEYEKPGVYLKRICVANGWLNADGAIDLTRFQSTLDEMARTADEGKPYAADVSQRERKERKPKTIPAEVTLKVTAIYDGPKRDAYIGAVKSKLGITLEVTSNREEDIKKFSYAALDYDRAVKREQDEERKKRVALELGL